MTFLNVFFQFYFRNGEYVLKVVSKRKDYLSYRNELNSLVFPLNFTSSDFNIFFTICYLAKKHKYNAFDLPFEALTTFLNSNIKNKKRFCDEVVLFEHKALKLIQLQKIKTEDEEISGGNPFFLKLQAFRNKQILRIKLNPYAVDLLINFGYFMSFNMYEFCSIKGKYAKTIFRLIKQYENLKGDELGKKVIHMDKQEFLRFVNSPESYDDTDIDRYVLKPSIKELNNGYYKNLDYEKVKAKNNKKVTCGYRFTFEMETMQEKIKS